ncbi:MAG: YciI family protein [Solirubrobacterales bacterium]
MPKYLLSVHSVEGEPRPEMSDEQMQGFMKQIEELEAEMRSSGAFVFTGGLHPPDTATVVHPSEGDLSTTDGPFADAKEHIAGFYVLEADDLDAAMGWAQRVTACVGKPIEVRPFRDAHTV